MKKGFDIHNISKKLVLAEKRLMASGISDRNKEIILEFRDFCSLEGIGDMRVERYFGALKDMAEVLNVDFDKATKKDIIRLVRVINNRDWSDWTKVTFKKMLKRFYKWVKDSDDVYPDEVKWIKCNLKRYELKLPGNGDLITEDEVKKLISVAQNPRDKAFVALLYESGARIGELTTLQICNVKVDEYGAILHVEGKTGCRPIRIISSTPYLLTWLENHPHKDDSQCALWVGVGNCKFGEPINYHATQNILRRLFVKAGIKKRCNAHLFRHSRATFLADHLTESQMDQFFGWIQGSGMPSTYIHMSGKNIDGSILELNGVKTSKSSNESNLKPKICSRCDTINSHSSKFCNKCAGILDIATANELQNKLVKENEMRNKSDTIMNMLTKDPEVLKVIVNKVKELGLEENFSV